VSEQQIDSTFVAPADDASWGPTGALATPAIAGAETFCTTPVLDLMRSAAALNPDAIAVSGLIGGLSFRDLLRMAETTACAVAERTRPGDAVAWMLPRRPENIAVLLGCLISGRPCVIVDASDPPERRAALLADAAPALVLTTETSAVACSVLGPDAALSGPDRRWRPDHVSDPDAPFAIHFTSGSTGRPRGIVLSARSVLYRGLQAAQMLTMTSETRMAQPNVPIASTGLSVLLGVLSVAGRVVLLDLANEGAGAALTLIEREAVTYASFTPAVADLMLGLRRAGSAFRRLRVLRLGAGAVPWTNVAVWRFVLPPDCVIVNAYASTEALTVAHWVVPNGTEGGDEPSVPAGVLHLCHDYTLLDEGGQPVAPGEAGELVVRGQYVALGEWRDGGLVPGRMTPVQGRAGWREFRTGDVVRVHADGMLRVIGRVDRQVKINGVLLQPAEIEAVLKSDPAVTDAAVVARTTPAGVTLHGFVAATDVDQAALVTALRRKLAARLPAGFRLARLTVMDRLPILPAGKVDLMALTRLAEE
jgi:acyl-CoA synthetase (AMP-forming)/AMP-acid ligase II